MKYNYLLFGGIITIGLTSCFSSDETEISGTIKNSKRTAEMYLYEVANPNSKVSQLISIDSIGFFSVKVAIDNPGYYVIMNNKRKAFNVYIEPGNHVKITSQSNYLVDSLRFSGDQAMVNNFISKVRKFNRESRRIFRERFFALTDAEFDSELKNTTSKIQDYIKKNKGELSLEIVEVELKRSLFQSQLLRLQFPNLYKTKIDSTYTLPITYFDNEENLNLNNPKLITKLEEYRMYVYNRQLEGFIRDYEKNIDKNETLPYIDLFSAYIDKQSLDEKVKEYLLLIGARRNVFSRRKIKSDYTYTYTFLNERIKDRYLKDKLADLYQLRTGILKGQNAPDFSAINEKGEEVSFNSLDKKWTLINVWSTKSRESLKEMKLFDNNKLDARVNQSLQIINVSLDKKRIVWERKVNRLLKSKNVYNWYVPKGIFSEFAKAYYIDQIPQYIVIDPKGKIVTGKSVKPSSLGFYRLFDSIQ